VTDYFSEKIERTCAFYEAQSRKIDAKYLAEVEKLASRFDWVLADFIRSTVRPTRIRSAVESVRCSLQAGDIVAADQKHSFCKAHGISRRTFYNLIRSGKGPHLMHVGTRVLISREAAADWRRNMEAGEAA
jgi:excisionase family DNA binding protein